MKVLMTTDTIGGVWTYTMTLCEALGRYGVDIQLATMGRKLSCHQRQQVDSLEWVTVHESDYRLCWMANSDEDVAAAGQWLLELEQALQPDLIHLNDLGHVDLNWTAPRLLVVHSCVYSWWRAVLGVEPPRDEWWPYRTRIARSLGKLDVLIAPSTAMLEEFTQIYGRTAQGTVVHNGSRFPSSASIKQLERRKESLVFGAGRLWDDAKNLKMLVGAAPHLPWRVCLAGEQDDPNGGHRDMDGIECLGHLDPPGMAEWLARAAIYVAPVRYEPFGLAILEAARSGCALVVGDIPSLREIWGDSATYVDPDSPAALIEAINDLIHNPTRRRAMAAAALSRSQTYTTATMAAAYMKHYRALIQNNPTGPLTSVNTITEAY